MFCESDVCVSGCVCVRERVGRIADRSAVVLSHCLLWLWRRRLPVAEENPLFLPPESLSVCVCASVVFGSEVRDGE